MKFSQHHPYLCTMKKYSCLLLFIWAAIFSAKAQDAYHTGLQTQLQTDYALPSGQWILPNTESATFTGAIQYGVSVTNITVTGQPFTQARSMVVTGGIQPWDAGHLYKNQTAITNGNKCLLVVWLRSPTAGSQINVFAENAITYNKELLSTIRLTPEWKQYLIRFQSENGYIANALSIGFHLAWLPQTVEVGGMAVLNYQNGVTLDQLPLVLHNDYYVGQEPDAPWRAEAAASIEQIRKANLTVSIKNANMEPVAPALVQVEMLQHEFGFGSAVVSSFFNGGSSVNAIYQQKITDLDGNGHGFNEVVFENDLKWDGWEQHWYSSQPEIASDMQWLKDRDIKVRGHNLVWPGWQYLPDDMQLNQNNPNYLKTRIKEHLNEILTYPGVGAECADWDVLNEITVNSDLANALAGTPGYVTGREIYTEIFKQADSLVPDAKLYLNDYVAIENGDAPLGGITTWKSHINEMIQAGAPIEGIGFQGHFGAFPTSIPKVKEIYDDFYTSFGLEAKVTEYDISNLVPDQTQADYLRDILTLTFAHPSMKGFTMWGHWDGAHWLGNAPLFYPNWTLKPSGMAFVNQVFNEWWTKVDTQTGTDGTVTVRGFKGKYRVSVLCGDLIVTEYVTLDADKTLEIYLPCTVGINTANDLNGKISVSPTMVQGDFNIQWENIHNTGELTLDILDAGGKLVQSESIKNGSSAGSQTLNVDALKSGVYMVQVRQSGSVWQQRIVVVR